MRSNTIIKVIIIMISVAFFISLGVALFSLNPITDIDTEPKNYNLPPYIDEEGNHNFYFQDKHITITPPKDEAAYQKAKYEKPSPYYYSGTSEEEFIIEYYPKFITPPTQKLVVADIVEQLNTIQETYGYDSDEYVELATSYVQGIPYHNDGEGEPQHPIETLYEYSGGVDDKSILLASILSQAGYDVALLGFFDQHHMAVGIKVDPQYAYPNADGYGIIEVGGTWFVSDIPTELTSTPLVIPIKGGTKTYTAADQVAYIQKTWNEIASLLNAADKGYVSISNRQYNAGVDCYNLLTELETMPNREYIYEKMVEYNGKFYP